MMPFRNPFFKTSLFIISLSISATVFASQQSEDNDIYDDYPTAPIQWQDVEAKNGKYTQSSDHIFFSDQRCAYAEGEQKWVCESSLKGQLKMDSVGARIQLNIDAMIENEIDEDDENSEQKPQFKYQRLAKFIEKHQDQDSMEDTTICIRDISIDIEAADQDREILWNRMSVTVNGYAKEAVPSFIANAALRNTYLPAGQRYSTEIRAPLHNCLIVLDKYSNDAANAAVEKTTVTSIKLPFKLSLKSVSNEVGSDKKELQNSEKLITVRIHHQLKEASDKEALLRMIPPNEGLDPALLDVLDANYWKRLGIQSAGAATCCILLPINLVVSALLADTINGGQTFETGESPAEYYRFISSLGCMAVGGSLIFGAYLLPMSDQEKATLEEKKDLNERINDEFKEHPELYKDNHVTEMQRIVIQRNRGGIKMRTRKRGPETLSSAARKDIAYVLWQRWRTYLEATEQFDRLKEMDEDQMAH